MSANFALRLSDLRKEKKISQKEAASCLGISQALLSHYEKGIRECGLDFLKKACDYYDVSVDYLLGLTDRRYRFEDVYSNNELSSDSELCIKTLIRALVDITDRLSDCPNVDFDKLTSELLLSVYRFVVLSGRFDISDKSWFDIDINNGDMLVSSLLESMFAEPADSEIASEFKYTSEPQYIKTVIDNSEKLICRLYEKMIKSEKT